MLPNKIEKSVHSQELIDDLDDNFEAVMEKGYKRDTIHKLIVDTLIRVKDVESLRVRTAAHETLKEINRVIQKDGKRES